MFSAILLVGVAAMAVAMPYGEFEFDMVKRSDVCTFEIVKDPDPNGFRNSIETAHNDARRAHDVGPVGWNSQLASQAQLWADQKAADICNKTLPAHSPKPGNRNNNEGENVATGYSTHLGYIMSGRYATKRWYDEIHQSITGAYPYGWEEGKDTDAELGAAVPYYNLHFTALIWKDVTQIGCGRAIVIRDKPSEGAKRAYTIIVCQYLNPSGKVNCVGTGCKASNQDFANEVLPKPDGYKYPF